MKSDNNTVNTISMMGVKGLYSVLRANYRAPCTKYGMNLNNIIKVCNERCATDEEIIRKCEQVREFLLHNYSIFMYILNLNYVCVFLFFFISNV